MGKGQKRETIERRSGAGFVRNPETVKIRFRHFTPRAEHAKRYIGILMFFGIILSWPVLDFVYNVLTLKLWLILFIAMFAVPTAWMYAVRGLLKVSTELEFTPDQIRIRSAGASGWASFNRREKHVFIAIPYEEAFHDTWQERFGAKIFNETTETSRVILLRQPRGDFGVAAVTGVREAEEMMAQIIHADGGGAGFTGRTA